MYSGMVNVFLVPDRLSLFGAIVEIPCIDFSAVTVSYNWEPYLARMPVIVTEGTLRLVTGVLGLALVG